MKPTEQSGQSGKSIKSTCAQLLAETHAVEEEIKNLGPVLVGTIKHNVNRTRRKDGSIHTSKTHHTFVYRDQDGKECWKRVGEADLPAVEKLAAAGRRYRELARQHAALATRLALLAPEKKTLSRPASRSPG